MYFASVHWCLQTSGKIFSSFSTVVKQNNETGYRWRIVWWPNWIIFMTGMSASYKLLCAVLIDLCVKKLFFWLKCFEKWMTVSVRSSVCYFKTLSARRHKLKIAMSAYLWCSPSWAFCSRMWMHECNSNYILFHIVYQSIIF